MSTAERPWLIRSGAFGDMVMLTAACEAAARRHGTPCGVIGTGPWNEAVFSRCRHVAEIITLESMRTPGLLNPRKREAIRRLRAEAPACVYVCGGDQASHDLAAKLALPAERIRSVRKQERIDNEHQVDEQIRLVDDSRPAILPQLQLHDDDRSATDAWLDGQGLGGRQLILVQAGNKKTMKGGSRTRSSNVKHWSEAHWQRCLQALHELHPEHVLVICGTAEERSIGDDIAIGLPEESRFNACGELPFARLFALAERAFAMLSVDTGPAHAAAAVGCPLVVLFGTTDPRRYRPLGSAPCLPVHAIEPPYGDGIAWWREHHRMADITPELVLERWDELLTAMP